MVQPPTRKLFSWCKTSCFFSRRNWQNIGIAAFIWSLDSWPNVWRKWWKHGGFEGFLLDLFMSFQCHQNLPVKLELIHRGFATLRKLMILTSGKFWMRDDLSNYMDLVSVCSVWWVFYFWTFPNRLQIFRTTTNWSCDPFFPSSNMVEKFRTNILKYPFSLWLVKCFISVSCIFRETTPNDWCDLPLSRPHFFKVKCPKKDSIRGTTGPHHQIDAMQSMVFVHWPTFGGMDFFGQLVRKDTQVQWMLWV